MPVEDVEVSNSVFGEKWSCHRAMKSVAVIKSEFLTGPGTFSIHCLLTSTFHLQAAIASVTHGNPKKEILLPSELKTPTPSSASFCVRKSVPGNPQ